MNSQEFYDLLITKLHSEIDYLTKKAAEAYKNGKPREYADNVAASNEVKKILTFVLNCAVKEK